MGNHLVDSVRLPVRDRLSSSSTNIFFIKRGAMRRLKFISAGVTIFLLLIISSCEENITSTCEIEIPSGTEPVSLQWIQDQVFTPYCISCHGNSLAQGGLNLAQGKAHSNLVGVTATSSLLKRVDPQFPENSYLLKRMEGLSGESVMPPAGKISQVLIDSVSVWIERGALEN